MSDTKFETWAIIELFGHSRIAGKVSEATIGGCAFLRVDVPEIEGHPAHTRYFGNGAIYSMSPVTEQIAKAYADRIASAPVAAYYLRQPALPSGYHVSEDDDF